jgi:hypothetical protein
LEFEDKLVGCTKWFDGSILDIIKKVKGLNWKWNGILKLPK